MSELSLEPGDGLSSVTLSPCPHPLRHVLSPGGITPAQASNPLAGGAASRPYFAAGLYGEGEVIGVGWSFRPPAALGPTSS